MTDMPISLDKERAEALRAVVSAGGAASIQEALEQALDAYLADQALSQLSDDDLARLWQEGIESGDAGELDLAALKKEARGGAA